MKLKNLSIILIAALFLVFAGCKKDSDNDPATTGQFTYAGTSYALSQGFLGGYGEVGINSYGIEVVLMSSGLQVIETNGIADSISGTGDIFVMDLYSAAENTIEPGEYSYAESGIAGTFEYSIVLIGYDAATEEVEVEDEVVGGTVTVTKDGDTYGFSFNLTTMLGKTITGDYSGSMKFYSGIDKKSALVLK
jgi:hypothetical protein